MNMTTVMKKIITYIVHVTDPEKIILFGSYAHGKNNVYSDIDLLIITQSAYRRRELEIQISSYMKEVSLNADILIHTPDEISYTLSKPYSFLSLIYNDGVVVYQK